MAITGNYTHLRQPRQQTAPEPSHCPRRHPAGLGNTGGIVTLEKTFIRSAFQRICSTLAQMGQQAPARGQRPNLSGIG